MAKSRRNRANSHRADPITKQGKPPKPPSDPELAAIRQDRILPVLKDLRSVELKSRTAAAGAIANIIHDSKCRKLLLREQVVHVVLTETLADSSLESKAAGWEILKVLALNEESDFAIHLFRSDVLSAAEYASSQVCKRVPASQMAGPNADSPPDSRDPQIARASFRKSHQGPPAVRVGHLWISGHSTQCSG